MAFKPADRNLKDGDKITVGGIDFEIIHTQVTHQDVFA